MPSWITHLVTANKLLNRIEIKDKNSFLFGNVMPDILNNYIVKDTNVHRQYKSTHFTDEIMINGIKYEFPNPDKFLEEYKEKMNNPVIYGFYVHLLTDYFWNKISYTNHFKEHNGLVEIQFVDGTIQDFEFDDAIRIKQKDFAMFTDFLKNNNIIERINYSDDLVHLSNEITELPLTKADIEKTLTEVDKFLYGEEILVESNYKLFTQDKLNDYLEESVDYIIERLNAIG